MPSPKTYGKIRPLQLIAVIFFTVSGGPYGLEPLLSYAQDHGAMLLLLITPFTLGRTGYIYRIGTEQHDARYWRLLPMG